MIGLVTHTHTHTDGALRHAGIEQPISRCADDRLTHCCTKEHVSVGFWTPPKTNLITYKCYILKCTVHTFLSYSLAVHSGHMTSSVLSILERDPPLLLS